MIDIAKPVKLSSPEPGEEHLIFRVTNYNEVTNRCYIQPLNGKLNIVGQELVSINDIENI